MSGLLCVQSEILMRLISAGALVAAPGWRGWLVRCGAYAVADTPLAMAALACWINTCWIWP